jgi:hypothetical protein
MAVQFAYDSQIRRFVLQFIRMVSNFQVEFGRDTSGVRTLQTVPVYYGDPSRQASMILRNNSENSLNAVPAMSVYIGALTYDRDRLLNPYFEGSMTVREQVYDESTQSYTGRQDGIYTVDRLMPAPYKLTVKLDIWTSNTEQKHQLIEQMAPLFNPGFEIQNSDNFVDWGSLSVVHLTDVSYTNRSIPVGGAEDIDVASLTFEMPIWLSLPAKVKKMGVVAEIIASIYAANGELSTDVTQALSGLISQQRYTPMDYELEYMGNTLTIYRVASETSFGTVVGQRLRWQDVVNTYGELRNGISQVRLRFEYPDGMHEIVGTVAYDPTDESNLLFTPIPSTLPANTLDAVTAIIDPFTVEVNSALLTPVLGTRYLILNPIGEASTDPAVAWRGAEGTNLLAKANDIIEWTGSYWVISFDSHDPGTQYVTNMNTTVQYRWTGESWVKSYEGLYHSGDWSLVI